MGGIFVGEPRKWWFSSWFPPEVSKYSLRIFLNEDLEGGCSVFHVPWAEPVEFQPKTGMALVYPQGEMCTVQETATVANMCFFWLLYGFVGYPLDRV